VAEKEFYKDGPVDCWKVVSRNKVSGTFSRKREADAYVAASGNPRLTVLPVYEKEVEKRGGKRPGSGRKPKDASGKAVTVSFCCSPEQKDKLKAAVKESGMKQSEYILDKLKL
jgi:hypothetical protein